MVKQDFPVAEEGKWNKAPRDEKPWECLFEGCKSGPFINMNHFGHHLWVKHDKALPTQILDLKPKEGSKKMNINSCRMNAKVLNKPFKWHGRR
jgi:hypothetical protein